MSDVPKLSKKALAKAKRELRERVFIGGITIAKLQLPAREYVFARDIGRGWRFDFSWPDRRVALEVEGGAFVAGRHTRGAGFRDDIEKYNEATARGWLVLRALPEQLTKAALVDLVARTLELRKRWV